jgi:predicted nucleic acid-binding protein
LGGRNLQHRKPMNETDRPHRALEEQSRAIRLAQEIVNTYETDGFEGMSRREEVILAMARHVLTHEAALAAEQRGEGREREQERAALAWMRAQAKVYAPSLEADAGALSCSRILADALAAPPSEPDWLREYERRKLALIEAATICGQGGSNPEQDAAERALDEWVLAALPGGREREPEKHAAEWIRAVLRHYPVGWAFDPTQPDLMVDNLIRVRDEPPVQTYTTTGNPAAAPQASADTRQPEREPLRKYADDERPTSPPFGAAGCYDCGRHYGDEHGFPDLVIPDDAWEEINPTYHRGAGLLCPSCIVARCVAAGLSTVPAMWASGPLVAEPYRAAGEIREPRQPDPLLEEAARYVEAMTRYQPDAYTRRLGREMAQCIRVMPAIEPPADREALRRQVARIVKRELELERLLREILAAYCPQPNDALALAVMAAARYIEAGASADTGERA